MRETLAIALTKGRILTDTLPLLAAAGIEPAEDATVTRKLQVGTNLPDTSLLLVRASDVPAYVEYGGADVGITGKDILLEHTGNGLYEPLDLGIGRCKLVLAGVAGVDPFVKRRLRVATKYPEVTQRYFASRGQQVEVIKLYGSMELAPLVGMADVIVDIMETGTTLKANGLNVLDEIGDVSARLIVNKASMKMKHATIHALIANIKKSLLEN
ncbi:ATP phosphoribosyltransferase [Chromatiales bacterium (ex Bugula neritina AB1)]|nr:ATP phosphoribosyltransferase [Chromatiales bacterium (ex Bugula neritina AB1)]